MRWHAFATNRSSSRATTSLRLTSWRRRRGVPRAGALLHRLEPTRDSAQAKLEELEPPSSSSSSSSSPDELELEELELELELLELLDWLEADWKLRRISFWGAVMRLS
jgi:hypothetical protein